MFSELAFFFHLFTPWETTSQYFYPSFLKRVERWRVSWIRSIAGAGNDLGKRTKLNFPHTLGGFWKGVLVVSFILENVVSDKFFHGKFSKKTQLHWSVSIFINVLLRSTKENAYYSTLVPAGFTKVPRVLLWMTYDFTVWAPSWTDWLAAIFSLDLMFFSSIMCRARHWRAFVYWRGLFIRKSVFAVRFHFSFLCRKSCTQISRYTVMLTMC